MNINRVLSFTLNCEYTFGVLFRLITGFHYCLPSIISYCYKSECTICVFKCKLCNHLIYNWFTKFVPHCFCIIITMFLCQHIDNIPDYPLACRSVLIHYNRLVVHVISTFDILRIVFPCSFTLSKA